jgi:hypothetical protein
MFVVFRKGNQPTTSQIVRIERDGVIVANAQALHRSKDSTEVIAATYGDPANPARRIDVADLVRRDLANGRNTITANNDWAGSDPAPKTVKKLSVSIRAADREEKRFEVPEGEPVTLADSVPTWHPTCQVLNGGTRLLAWEPGHYLAKREDGTTLTWEAGTPRTVPLAGPWKLEFPAGWGAPASTQADKLISWTDMDLSPEGRAFSGTATYSTEFTLGPAASTSRVELDLGRVEVIASVLLNGETLGTVWTAPYRLDLTGFTRPGVNRLVVRVTNTWFNRLVYDAGLDEKARKTWTISGPAKNRPLTPAGLLGPVVVRIGQTLNAGNVR